MPYFVFRIDAEAQPEYLDKYANYREARDCARQLRSELPAGDTSTYKMIFANNEIEAEKLLTTPREAPVEGDD